MMLFFVTSFHSVQAFEPVPIDEFFKRYPDERGNVEDFFKDSEKKIVTKKDIIGDIIRGSIKAEGPELHEPKAVRPHKERVKVRKMNKAQLLVLNRISGERQIVNFRAGDTKNIDNFRILMTSCKKRVVNSANRYTAVAFQVFDLKKKKISPLQEGEKEKQTGKKTGNKTESPKDNLIFSNHIYIELPGLNAFEHPIYDIRPLSCS